MGQLGADVEQLDRLAATMGREGARIRGAMGSTTALVTFTWWQGGDADRARTWWSSTGRSQLERGADGLEQLRDALRRQADEQRKASGTGEGGGGGGVVGWVRDRVEGAWDAATDWASDAWEATEDWARETIGTIADTGASVFGGVVATVGGWFGSIGNAFVDWVVTPLSSLMVAAWDRVSTFLQYEWETMGRLLRDPLQAIRDIRTGTFFLEQFAAAESILVEDGELFHPDDPRFGDATYITGVATPAGSDAITLGHTVRISGDEPSPDLIAHEYQHVVDIEDVGAVTFYATYGGEYLANRMAGMGDDEAYRSISWEVRAYEITDVWSDADPNNNRVPVGILDGLGKFIPMPLPLPVP